MTATTKKIVELGISDVNNSLDTFAKVVEVRPTSLQKILQGKAPSKQTEQKIIRWYCNSSLCL